MNPKPDREKIVAAKAAKAAARAEQIIEINEEWRIVRADEWNWEIKFKGKSKGYYGRLRHAFEALADKMIDQKPCNSVALVLNELKGIREVVEAAANRAVFAMSG